MPSHDTPSKENDKSNAAAHEKKQQGISFRPPPPRRDESDPLDVQSGVTPGPFASVQMKSAPLQAKNFSSVPLVIQGVFKIGSLDDAQRIQMQELRDLLKTDIDAPADQYETATTTYNKTADHEVQLRLGTKRSITYRSDTAIELTFTVYTEKNKDPQLSVASVGYVREGRNLKASRTDDNEYRWIGNMDEGKALGMTENRKLMSEADLPDGYVESHLSGMHGIRYFKKINADRANQAAPSFLELAKSGRGIRSVNGKHTMALEDRDSANAVMGASATQYAGHMGSTLKNEITKQTGNVPNLKVEGNFNNGISYEWCHLIGHGDGGKEVPENFVSGTHYANTEQLAIETGLRNFRDLGLELRVMAFFPEVRKGITVDAYYADYVMYEILHANKTIFSHTFSMHSSSFDVREWNMLQADVQKKLSAELQDDLTDNHKSDLNSAKEEMANDAESEVREKKGRSTKNFEKELWGELSTSAEESATVLKAAGLATAELFTKMPDLEPLDQEMKDVNQEADDKLPADDEL